MNIRVSAEDAGWSIREAAWGFEKRVLWRGSDVTRAALDRGSHVIQPLQQFVQTKLTWPLGDAYRARSLLTRRVLATSAIAVVLGAGAAGALTATDHPAAAPHSAPPLPAASATAAPANPNAVAL